MKGPPPSLPSSSVNTDGHLLREGLAPGSVRGREQSLAAGQLPPEEGSRTVVRAERRLAFHSKVFSTVYILRDWIAFSIKKST